MEEEDKESEEEVTDGKEEAEAEAEAGVTRREGRVEEGEDEDDNEVSEGGEAAEEGDIRFDEGRRTEITAIRSERLPFLTFVS